MKPSDAVRWELTLDGQTYRGGCTIDPSVIDAQKVEDVLELAITQLRRSYARIKAGHEA